MSLETYAERTKPWISTGCVMDRYELDHFRWLLRNEFLGPDECCAEANELIERRLDDARRDAAIKRVHADVRRAWPIVPRGGKC